MGAEAEVGVEGRMSVVLEGVRGAVGEPKQTENLCLHSDAGTECQRDENQIIQTQ